MEKPAELGSAGPASKDELEATLERTGDTKPSIFVLPKVSKFLEPPWVKAGLFWWLCATFWFCEHAK